MILKSHTIILMCLLIMLSCGENPDKNVGSDLIDSEYVKQDICVHKEELYLHRIYSSQEESVLPCSTEQRILVACGENKVRVDLSNGFNPTSRMVIKGPEKHCWLNIDGMTYPNPDINSGWLLVTSINDPECGGFIAENTGRSNVQRSCQSGTIECDERLHSCNAKKYE